MPPNHYFPEGQTLRNEQRYHPEINPNNDQRIRTSPSLSYKSADYYESNSLTKKPKLPQIPTKEQYAAVLEKQIEEKNQRKQRERTYYSQPVQL
jgi:hypothetical protein